AATGVSVRSARVVAGSAVGVRVGAWRPGVYAARLDDGGTVVQAPLVVRASARSRPRVAVVLPTSTWQAYNLTDADGDGTGDTWYASRRRESARLDRPFMGDGMPPFFHRYDLPFLRWLRASGHDADFLGDDDLDRVGDAATLLRRYDLLVFPGHHEYVTLHERDLVEQYRDGGGNLAFLSADAFHWRVERRGAVVRRKERWGSLGHPRDRSRPRLAVRVERGRDLRHDGRLAGRHLRRRRDPEPARRGTDGADDVLRDPAGRKGVRGGSVLSREPLCHGGHAPRQPLDAARTAVTRRMRIGVASLAFALLLGGAGHGASGAPTATPRITCTLPPGTSHLPATARRGLIGHLEQYPDVSLA